MLAFYENTHNIKANFNTGQRPTLPQHPPVNPYVQPPVHPPQAYQYGQQQVAFHKPVPQGNIQYPNQGYGQPNYQMVNNQHPGKGMNVNQLIPNKQADSLPTYELNLNNQEGVNPYDTASNKIEEYTESKK